jgi:hypothetical protein
MSKKETDSHSFRPPETTETIADRFVDPRTFCRLRFSPMLATGVILGLLREHFGNPTAIVDPMLQAYVWRDDDQSRMMIETSSNEVLTRIQMRPAVLIRRNTVRAKREGLDDELKKAGPEQGREFVVTLHGSHTVFCLSAKQFIQHDLEACLALEVAENLWEYLPNNLSSHNLEHYV